MAEGRDGFGDIETYHAIENIDNKYKNKDRYRDTFYDYDNHTDTFSAMNNFNMSVPFPFTEEDNDPRM